MNSSVVLGIAGTAKNTGKTTALNALLAEARTRRVPVGVTSIGYDGESVDNVTGLPKPRIVLQPGTIATTSRGCLPSAGWEIVESTEASTALGQVLIVRCLEAGPLVLAGPNKRQELGTVVARMRELGAHVTFIDGALNRLAPMTAADGLILATGAARQQHLPSLVAESSAIAFLLALRTAPPTPDLADVIIPVPFPDWASVTASLASSRGARCRVRLRAPVTPDVIRRLAEVSSVVDISWRDPIAAWLSSDPVEMMSALRDLASAGRGISVEQPLPLVAVTVNPFFPQPDGAWYRPAFVDAAELRESMRTALRVPVVDVLQDGAGALWTSLQLR